MRLSEMLAGTPSLQALKAAKAAAEEELLNRNPLHLPKGEFYRYAKARIERDVETRVEAGMAFEEAMRLSRVEAYNTLDDWRIEARRRSVKNA